MSTGQPEPTEEELRAAYEQELKRIRVEHLLLETIVSLVNVGMRRAGVMPGTEDERDAEQVRLSVEGVRALLPLVEQAAPAQAGPIREALAQLQLAFVRMGGSAAPDPGPPPPPDPGPPPPSDPGAPPAPGTDPGAPPAPGTDPGAPPGPAPDPANPPGESGGPEEPGPAQRSGRLWIPGQ
jgi:hypothetical protein